MGTVMGPREGWRLTRLWCTARVRSEQTTNKPLITTLPLPYTQINIRVEYRYCPNMVVIDTPGLISGGGGRGDIFNRHSANPQVSLLN